MLPLVEDQEIRRWEDKLAVKYPDPTERMEIKEDCKIGDVYFETRKIKDILWGFANIKQDSEKCLIALLNSSGNIFKILRRKLFANRDSRLKGIKARVGLINKR